MRRLPALSLSVILLTLLAISTARAQQPKVLVSFVVDSQFGTASLTDPGPRGLSHLGEIFTDLGARVNYINLRQPIPAETQVIVLVHPIKPVTVAQAARLWLFLHDGKNILLALRPGETSMSADANLSPKVAGSGIDRAPRSGYGSRSAIRC